MNGCGFVKFFDKVSAGSLYVDTVFVLAIRSRRAAGLRRLSLLIRHPD